jgi:isopentenyl-diphosphate delta-isomerase
MAKSLKVRYLGDVKMEYLILVDSNDKSVGTEEKVKCHLPQGKLHRAFTILLFNNEGKLLLTQRSKNKMLWPGDWDGTVASHPRQSETYVSSAERRLPEELGITCRLEYLYKFEYHVPYKNIGSENEVCGTLMGIIDNSEKVKLVEDEISAIRWVTFDELLSEIEKLPQIFCPWMIIALYFLPESKNNTFEANKKILKMWNKDELRNRLEASLKYHFPDHRWSLKRD